MRRKTYRRRLRKVASRARKAGAVKRNSIFHRRGGIRL